MKLFVFTIRTHNLCLLISLYTVVFSDFFHSKIREVLVGVGADKRALVSYFLTTATKFIDFPNGKFFHVPV